MSAKTRDYQPPPAPRDFDTLLPPRELGWVNEDKIRKYAFPPSPTSRVFICGLPGIYDKLCGPRTEMAVATDSVLYQLGYCDKMVVKF
jgi:cytochrome-b5 reductase